MALAYDRSPAPAAPAAPWSAHAVARPGLRPTLMLRGVLDAIRSPQDALEGLPDFPFQPHYREVEGLRLAHIDEGSGAPVLFLHGEPTWSFLWRKVIPSVRDAGFRCVAPDLAGFGRSDKPVDIAWYTYDRHVALAATLLEDLDLRGTVVVHDWGGPIGLRLAVEHPERIERLVILDTGLFPVRQRMSEAWQAFRDFVERTEDLPVGMLVRGGCHVDPGDDVISAYDAPFPTAAAKAGARAFPLLIPLSPDAPGAAASRHVLEQLREDRRPTLMLWADSDPIIPLSTGERFAQAIGRPAPRVIEHAGHFLQEDQGPVIGEHIAAWLTAG
jgi:haloalkane dehalogenase